MPRKLLERRKLKVVRDFLNENKNWICLNECKKDDPQCEFCAMGLMINYTYSSNKSSNFNTFYNSYLYEPFQKTVEIYEKYKDASWNNKIKARKTNAIKKIFCCIVMQIIDTFGFKIFKFLSLLQLVW